VENGERAATVTTDIAGTAMLLDQVRGVLFSKSNVGDEFLAPVSTLAIRYALVARSLSTDPRALLDILLDLRDVQNLPRGHWLPVSTRCVPCGRCALVVSGAPTEFLRRDHGVVVRGHGLGRLLVDTMVSDIPTEPLQRWLGAPASSMKWCEDLIRQATFGDWYGWQDLLVYDHWSKRSANRWGRAEEVAPPDGPVLARLVKDSAVIGHFLLIFRSRTIRGMHEFPGGFESRRFALAMLRRAGNAFGFSFAKCDTDTHTLRCPYLPAPEHRLLRALGSVDETERGMTARIPSAAVEALEDMLQNLGLKSRGLQDG
jgi:hypothetical protein